MHTRHRAQAITQADVDAGRVRNTATAVGTPPSGENVEDEDPNTVTVPGNPGITVEKDGGLPADAGHVAGETITYAFTATNTGNVTLTDVRIVDEKEGLSELTYTWPDEAHVLAPGQSVTATATYVLTQADVDAGRVDNTATAVGTPPSGGDVEDEDPHVVPVRLLPAIDLVKDGSLAAGPAAAAGDTVTYSFTATNTGNVTLTAVAVEDAMEGLYGFAYGAWPGAERVLAPGQSVTVTATASYDLTQADVDAGRVDNTATAVGTPPSGADVADADQHTVTLTGGAGIALVKEGMLAAGATPAEGDTVTYTFTATNTGDVTLTGVTIVDDKEGLYGFSYGTWPGAEGVLAPGESVTATGFYDLTQADVDAGEVLNTATATGTPPSGPEVSAADDALVELGPLAEGHLPPVDTDLPQPDDDLATTGVDAAGWILVASLLLIGGAAAMTRARRA